MFEFIEELSLSEFAKNSVSKESLLPALGIADISLIPSNPGELKWWNYT